MGTSNPTILPGISPWFLRGARYDDVDGFRYVGLDGAVGIDAGFRTVLSR